MLPLLSLWELDEFHLIIETVEKSVLLANISPVVCNHPCHHFRSPFINTSNLSFNVNLCHQIKTIDIILEGPNLIFLMNAGPRVMWIVAYYLNCGYGLSFIQLI